MSHQSDLNSEGRLRVLYEVLTTELTEVRKRELFVRLRALGLTKQEIEEFTPELLPGHAAQYA